MKSEKYNNVNTCFSEVTKRFLLVIQVLFFAVNLQAQPIKINVLQFNIWQEGTVIGHGFDAIVEEIIRLDADLVALSEVRNYNNKKLDERLVNAMKKRGLVFYAKPGEDSGILSRYPILEQTVLFPWKDDKGSVTKAIIKAGENEIVLYSAHLDYRNCASYLPRGYDGSTWEKLSAPVTDIAVIAADNLSSQRDEAVNKIIIDAKKEVAKGRLIFIGGDFNEPSHLDWIEKTKNLYDHNGVVFEWPNTKSLEKAGFIDAYRHLFPNPLTHPGFTYPADNRQADLKKLAWSPDADDRERIDYIFYYPDSRLKLTDAKIVGPAGLIVRNQRVEGKTSDPIDVPRGVWPTDHKAVLATFLLFKE